MLAPWDCAYSETHAVLTGTDVDKVSSTAIAHKAGAEGEAQYDTCGVPQHAFAYADSEGSGPCMAMCHYRASRLFPC